jgi:phage virion morphogenesis protein
MADENIQGLTELQATLGGKLRMASDMRNILMEIAQKQVSSFQENFRVSGRPPWEPSQRVKKHGGNTLMLTGRLMKSITIPEVTNTSITFGSNLQYAAIHQFGGDIHMPARSENFKRNRITRGPRKGKFKVGTSSGRGFTHGAYTITIPPRPYIVFQPKDIEDAGKICLGALLR